MDNMTQQNASLVEETASASEEMANQAGELLEMVQRFRISDEIKSGTYNKKHRELHVTAATIPVTRVKSDKGNGNGRNKSAETPTVSGSMTEILKQEGSEEF